MSKLKSKTKDKASGFGVFWQWFWLVFGVQIGVPGCVSAFKLKSSLVFLVVSAFKLESNLVFLESLRAQIGIPPHVDV